MEVIRQNRLYRHYKNKFYKYLGIARHSETLEEMVVYETRYTNPGGRLWVRPKTMFFENAELDGQRVSRFQEIELVIVEASEVRDSDLIHLGPIMAQCLGQWDPQGFWEKLKKQQGVYLLTAWLDGQPVGFKLGYELEPNTFYSWLGGVSPEYRSLGVASALLDHQHDWCRHRGYAKIKTKTKNRYRAMLLLNLKKQFNIVALEGTDPDEIKIVMERLLQPSPSSG